MFCCVLLVFAILGLQRAHADCDHSCPVADMDAHGCCVRKAGASTKERDAKAKADAEAKAKAAEKQRRDAEARARARAAADAKAKAAAEQTREGASTSPPTETSGAEPSEPSSTQAVPAPTATQPANQPAIEAMQEASALSRQAQQDLLAGNTKKACEGFAASLEKVDDRKTKEALAQCYVELGALVRARDLWRDLWKSSTDASVRLDAEMNTLKLQTRLARYTLHVDGSPAPGLLVTLNGVRVDALASDVEPKEIDPGPLTVKAAAPGHKGWSRTFQATEGRNVDIVIPPLPENAPPNKQVHDEENIFHEDSSTENRRLARRRKAGIVIASAGAAAVAVGLGFGWNARSKWNDAHADDHCNDREICDDPGFALIEDAYSSARVSTVLTTLGLAAIAGGAYVWFTGRHRSNEPAVSAAVHRDMIGVSVHGHF